MADSVVIIVPSQGHSTGAFLDSADQVRAKVYGGKATIVKTTVTKVADDKFLVKFTRLDGKAFSFDDAKNLSRVITISHAFSGDGPNLAYEAGGYQPWGTTADETALTPGGEAFWENVGHALAPNGLIILLGCFMGAGNYAKLVAQASDRAVYASTSLFAAGNSATAIKYVQAIEDGKTLAPMTKIGRPVTGFTPEPVSP